MNQSDIDRFWSKVNKDGPTMPHMDTPCWVWTKRLVHNGYGQFWLDGVHVRANRIALMLKEPPTEEGLDALHRCDNPACCNPSHLYWGTPYQNTQDMLDRGRHKAPIKLTPEKILLVVEALKNGEKPKAIAEEFNVDRQTIYEVKSKFGIGGEDE